MNFIIEVISRYHFVVSRFPFITNATTGFLIATIGDIYCQKYFEKKKVTDNAKPEVTESWNVRRSVEMGLIRAFVITPFILFWYSFLERVCPGASLLRLFGRLAIDQAFGSPFVICMVFTVNAALHGELSGLHKKIQHQFLRTWFTGMRYWPVVHSVNFSVVPLVHRSLFAHFAAVYWMAILSYYSNARCVEQKDVENS